MVRWSRWMLVLLPMASIACSNWKPVALGPEPRRLAATTMVVMKSGQRVELRNGYVGRDSVVGLQGELRRAIPRDSVLAVNERGGPSMAPMIMLGALAVGAAAFMLTGSSDNH
jgi:hypothetical protein